MYLDITNVLPTRDYNLILTFGNGEKRQFDMKPYLNTGIFQELKDIEMFNSVRVCFDTIEWDNAADLDPEMLYQCSVPLKE